MAKTESTAVNQLIELTQTATPLKPDPSDDLMFRAPPKKARMTSTVPSLKADVPPLPRMRAPQGTQSQGVPTIPAMPPTKPSVRMHTATHPITMPEVQPWAQAEGSGEMDVITDVRNQSVALKQTPKQTPKPALPPPRPSAPVVARANLAPEVPRPAPFPAPDALAYPSAAPYLSHVAADMTSHQPWFEEAQPASAPLEIEVDLGTDRVRSSKATDWKTLLPKLVAPTLGLCIVGMFVGGFLAFNGQGGHKKPATEPTTVAIKATAPVAELQAPMPEITAPKLAVKAVTETTPPNLAPHTAPAITTDAKAAPAAVGSRPAFVDVRLDSTPSGATVTLIDRGKSTFLGTTPISTALDPSRQYDLVFSHTSKPTQIEHLDPSMTKRLAIVLGKSTKPAVATETPKTSIAPKKLDAPKQLDAPKVDAPKKVVAADAPKPEVAKAEEPKKAVVDPVDPFDPAPKAAPKGDGVLMVSSKPPCEIVVDGVPTGLTTPQRALKLPAGTHKITLINVTEKIKKTVTVTISGDQPTKVIENFMK